MTIAIKYIKIIFKKFLSKRFYRLLVQGFYLVPLYYKDIISNTEKIIDIQENKKEDDEYYEMMLRKNAHILDKGLQRSDFEVGHGKIYKEQADYFLSKIKSVNILNDKSMNWCYQTMKEYDARQIDKNVKKEFNINVYHGSYSELINIIKDRRSIRNFKMREVEINIINKIFETVNYASSSCNKQPIKIFGTNKPEIAYECLKQCKGGTCFSKYVPTFFSVCADMRGYVLPSEIYLPYIDVSLGVQNSILIAHTLGLYSTILSWAQKNATEENNMRNILEIPEHYNIIFNIVLGYPENIILSPSKKTIEKTLIIR
jgi:hypothetical protein